MKHYIDFNTHKRKESTNESDKNFFKKIDKNINTKLLFTDRYCLHYEIHGKNPYKICKYKELFDLSNYPKSSKYYCTDNKK